MFLGRSKVKSLALSSKQVWKRILCPIQVSDFVGNKGLEGTECLGSLTAALGAAVQVLSGICFYVSPAFSS